MIDQDKILRFPDGEPVRITPDEDDSFDAAIVALFVALVVVFAALFST